MQGAARSGDFRSSRGGDSDGSRRTAEKRITVPQPLEPCSTGRLRCTVEEEPRRGGAVASAIEPEKAAFTEGARQAAQPGQVRNQPERTGSRLLSAGGGG